MTEKNKKLTRAMRTDETSSLHIENVSFDSWVVPYATLSHVLTDNKVQVTSKLFKTPCTMLGVQHLTAAAYHLQTNG